MVMRFKRDRRESWLHWQERQLGSGRYPGPLWARFAIGCIYFARRRIYEYRNMRARFRKVGTYRDKDLVYASNVSCDCGAGLAYPHGIGGGGAWYCSAVLKGTSKDGVHKAYPFTFYEINSEGQPSAAGHTTRPGVAYVRLGALWNTYVPRVGR